MEGPGQRRARIQRAEIREKLGQLGCIEIPNTLRPKWGQAIDGETVARFKIKMAIPVTLTQPLAEGRFPGCWQTADEQQARKVRHHSFSC
jgi:hypothetical protein